MTIKQAVPTADEGTVYAVSNATCCVCGGLIPAMNHYALGWLNVFAGSPDIDFHCPSCFRQRNDETLPFDTLDGRRDYDPLGAGCYCGEEASQ